MIVYADTSALVKLFLREDGSDDMLAVKESAEHVGSSAIAYAELRAAIAAATRDRRILPGQREDVLARLELLWSTIVEVPVDGALVRQAGGLAERLALRGYDAVHLASLLRLGNPETIAFACWDADLRRAAQHVGYRLV